jgi:hypothetical protein
MTVSTSPCYSPDQRRRNVPEPVPGLAENRSKATAPMTSADRRALWAGCLSRALGKAGSWYLASVLASFDLGSETTIEARLAGDRSWVGSVFHKIAWPRLKAYPAGLNLDLFFFVILLENSFLYREAFILWAAVSTLPHKSEPHLLELHQHYLHGE